MKNPGNEAPRVTDIKETNIPKKATRLTLSDLNQLVAILLGVLLTNIFPIEARTDPIKHQVGFYFYISNLSHTPEISNTAPKTKLILIPYLLMIQLQG